MNRIAILTGVFVLIFGGVSQADRLAFPGAEGYGAYAEGGRNGDVYHVTNLEDFNDYKGGTEPNVPGSLRYGIRTATGPRTIVFDVSGYIDLKARLEITEDNLYIAGQTAPGDGITIRHWDIRLYGAHNTIARHFRVRTGVFADQAGILSLPISDPNHLNGGLDCFSVEGSNNVILDHMSMSWSEDEVSSVSGDSNDVTVQWSTYAEPLSYTRNHAYGSLLRPAITSRITHHHNLYTDIEKRIARFGNYGNNSSTRYDWVNNIVFGWGDGGYDSTYSANNNKLWNYVTREGDGPGADGEFPSINFMGNYFIKGPAEIEYNYAFYGGSSVNTKIWIDGNYWDADEDGVRDGSLFGWEKITNQYDAMTQAFDIPVPLTIDTAPTAYERVVDYVGAFLVRDDVDVRIMNEVNDCNGYGYDAYDQNSVGGYPALAEVNRPAGFDTDGDGMPNIWELARGLDPNDANDRNDDMDNDQYTNLEEYLNYLAIMYGDTDGDYTGDEDVNIDDLFFFFDDWLVTDPCYVPAGDLYGDDNFVDFRDYAVFSANWSG